MSLPTPSLKQGGCTHNIFGWGCAARSWKPLPYFRPKYTIFHTLFQTWLSQCISLFQTLWGVVISATLNVFTAYGTSWRPKRSSRFISSRSMSTATHVTLKIYPRPNRRNIHPISDQNGKMVENDTLWGGTYLYGLYMSPPPPPGALTYKPYTANSVESGYVARNRARSKLRWHRRKIAREPQLEKSRWSYLFEVGATPW